MHSIQIQWEHMRGISANLRDFYGYLIQYKSDPVDDNYTEAGILKYDSTATWTQLTSWSLVENIGLK